MALEPGTKLGVYEILEPIGKGGMGEVYRARDTKLDRAVAIKVLPAEFAGDDERLARFEREARLLAQLNHPNVATLHGLEEHSGKPFLVMELVEGETLTERIARGAIPVREAVPLFIQIADGREAAHAEGIIHRDLKPANIKLGADGIPKILDFGLAKVYAGDTRSRNLSESPTVTKETAVGVVLGTAAYMSPEQARGKSLDEQTDIWSFGCVVFEALTQHSPFVGATATDTLAKILEHEPPWDALPSTAPPRLRELLEQTLTKPKRERLHDIADVRIGLARTVVSGGQETKRRINVWRRLGVAPALLGLAMGGALVWAVTRGGPSPSESVTRTAIDLLADQEIAHQNAPAVVLAPNGRHVAYVARSAGTTKLYLRSLDGLESHAINGSEGARMPFFSPDSQWLGFWVPGGTLMRASLGASAPVVVSEPLLSGLNSPDPRGASWDSEGRIVFAADSTTGLSRVSPDRESLEELTDLEGERREDSHRLPELLPGERAVLFTIGTWDLDSWDEAPIAVLSLETGEYRVLLEGGSNPRYSHSGHIVYGRQGALYAVAFDVKSLQVVGAPVRVVDGVVTHPLQGHAEFSLARDGSLLYVSGDAQTEDRQVMLVDRAGSARTLIDTRRPFLWAHVAPDGRSLALDLEGANRSMWTYEFGRGTLTRLAFGFDNRNPIWGPGSDSIVYSSTRPGQSNLFKQATGRGEGAEQLTDSPYFQMPSSWSPDGDVVAFEEARPDTGNDLWTFSMKDGAVNELLRTEFNERRPAFSPEGRWIAYESDESGRYEIYVQPFPGPGPRLQVSVDGGTQARWNPAGRELFYREADTIMAVRFGSEHELDLETPKALFHQPRPFPDDPYWGRDYDPMPDGQSFVMIQNAESDPSPARLILVQNWAEELKRLVPTDR